MTQGRPRRGDVQRKMDHCRHHGDTEFALHGQKQPKWHCMACAREDAKLRNMLAGKNVTEDEPRAVDRQEGRRGELCEDCWTIKSVTGSCLCD